ncbi:MAG: hypothetical protein K2M75_00310 [Clostridia bacterium]|nr:hypothetical protein [Clostridia bacterium]
MRIRKKKLICCIVIPMLIIACLLIASTIKVFTLDNFGNNSNQETTPLATTPVVNSPTIQMGKRVYRAGDGAIYPIRYSQFTTPLDDATIKVELLNDGTNAVNSNTTVSNKNSKQAYFDFATKLVVPAYTEYEVKYTVTCTIYKSAKDGNASTYLKFYAFGKDYTSDTKEDEIITAEKLYNNGAGTDLEFNNNNGVDNGYWVNGMYTYTQTPKVNKSTTYTYTTTHTNKTKSDKAFYHNYGYFGSIAAGSSYPSMMLCRMQVAATVTAKAIGQEPPTDVSAQYTGQNVTINDVPNDQKEWYKSAIMSPDYSANTDMVNLGDKKVKITITDPDEFFKGDPKDGTDESDIVRYITLTVKKKKIGVTINNDLSVTPASGAVFGGDTADNGRAPEFGFRYTSTDGKGYDSDTYPTNVGKYKATVKITNDCPYELDDTYSKEFEVEKKKVKKPTKPVGNNLTYNGKVQELELTNISDDVAITPQKDSGMEYDAVKKVLKAKDAKTYTVTIALKDNGVNSMWENTNNDTASYTLSLTIDAASLAVTFVAPDGGWSWNSNAEKTISITDNRKSDADGNYDQLTYLVSCDNTPISSSKIVADPGNPQKTNITVPALQSKPDKYTLKVSLDTSANDATKNYTLGTTTPEQKFNIFDKQITVADQNVIWSYHNKKGEKITLTLAQWSPSTTAVYDAIVYDGNDYDFTATLDGLDEDDEVVIIKTETKKSGNVVSSCIDAGDYATTVTLTSSKGVLSKSSFTVVWKIKKATLDLSNVSWDYDPQNPKEYNKGLNIEVKLKGLDDLPIKLEADYGDDTNKKKDVCNTNAAGEYVPYKAQVTFKNLPADIAKNYFKPVQSDRSTYICREQDEQGNWVDKNFPWTLNWIIKKAELDLDGEWEKVATEDKNNVVFRVYQVTNTTLAARITYEYYAEDEWDENNCEVIGNATPKKLEDIVVDLKNDPVKYWAVAKVNSANNKNYEIKKGTEAKKFTVGASTVIDVDLGKEFIYDGKAHGIKSEFKFDANPDLTDAVADVIVVKYYFIETVVGEDGTQVDNKIELKDEDLPNGAPTKVGKYTVSIDFKDEQYQDNYALSKFNFTFVINQAELTVALEKEQFVFDDKDLDLKLNVSEVKIIKTYYAGEEIAEDGSNRLADGVSPKNAGKYIVALSIDPKDEDNYRNYKIKDDCAKLKFEITQAELEISLDESKYPYDGEDKEAELTVKCESVADVSGVKIITTYYKGDEIMQDDSNKLADGELPYSAGKYIVVLSIDDKYKDNYKIKEGNAQFVIEITKIQIKANWDTTGDTPVLGELTEEQSQLIEYVYTDEDGNEYEVSQLQAGKKYTAIARIKKEYEDNYEFVNTKGVVLTQPTQAERSFEIKTTDTNPVTNGTLGNMIDKVKDFAHWQIIVIIVCTIFTLLFTAKTASYGSKRKKFKKKADKLATVYAGAYFGLATTAWTAIACAFIGVTVLSFVMMIIAKIRCNKAEEEYEEQLDEYNRNKTDAEARQRDESMRMILMGMMGGNANGGQGFAYGGQGVSADEMRLMINDAVTNMLPNVQQYLPQQASSNDDLMNKLIEQNAQNEERMRQMNEQNEKRIESLMQKLAEKSTEKEAASANISEETLERLVSKLQPTYTVAQGATSDTILKVVEKTEHNDETIKQLLKNQEALMDKIIELSNRKPEEKIVEKEVPVEKIVEKIVEVPVEVEKIVEKEIVKEVPVEKEIKVVNPAKPKKEPAPKLTLDEAYALLSKQQQKYFDGLKVYALSKDKCKEKKSTYFTVFGQSTVNPLMKLTVKKNMTVALFKMEDEYLKDIKRDASGDGTKMKVKETELIVSDAQAFETAKKMIDLREDQIERYQDLLKEQRSMKVKK